MIGSLLRKMTPLCSSCNKTQNPYQDNRTNDSNDDAANETKVGIGYKKVNEQAANECADEANNDVTDDSVAPGTHDPARQKAGNQANNEPDDQTCDTKCCTKNNSCKCHKLFLLLTDVNKKMIRLTRFTSQRFAIQDGLTSLYSA